MKGTLNGRWHGWSLWLPALALVVAVAIQGIHIFHEAPKSRGPHLAGTIPAAISGWDGRDVPIGANEFLANEVEKVLNYDDVVYRVFSREGRSFGVYVAYWGAGKMPTRLVASHTPDRCWTENGWRCVAMKFKQSNIFEGTVLKPAEWRAFEPPVGSGGLTYVLFWHLVEGHSYDYGERFNNIPDPLLWWKDAVQQALLGSREQYFIRLTSSEPLENFWADPGFKEVLRSLEEVGLAVRNPMTASK